MSGPEAAAVASALEQVGTSMTTLHVDRGALEDTVRGFPTVAAISADADFPKGLVVEVTERPPVMAVRSGGQLVPVAGDGTILAGVEAPGDVPVITAGKLPARGQVEGETLELARIAGAAPGPLAELIRKLRVKDDFGIEVTLAGGLPVRFGGAERAADKWAAAAAVLASPEVGALTYLDVRVPERPALGGAATGAAAATEPEVG